MDINNLRVVPSAHQEKKAESGSSFDGNGPGSANGIQFGDYVIVNGAFFQMKRSPKDGSIVVFPLCDFVCEIIEEVIYDTGVEDRSYLRIQGRRNDGLSLPLIDVPISKFYAAQGNWINEYYGSLVFVYPGAAKRDNLRAAIHLYSRLGGRDISRRQVFGYTGWKIVEGYWHYLTGSGAINSNGLVQSYDVDIGLGHMSNYRLPTPFDHNQIKAAAGLVIDLLEICPAKPHVGIILLSAVARAPLGECMPIDFVLFIYGMTGAKKSSIAAIAQAFFGEFNARNFPANWSDTENDLEGKSFTVKDGVFIVDDFKPAVSAAEAAKQHGKMERFVRNTGNQSARGRRKADMSQRAAMHNRSMSVITAEDMPKGQSIVGRMLLTELGLDDVDTATLTRLQQAADARELAGIMAAYIQWLACHMDELKKRYPKTVIMLRNRALSEGFATSHPRAPEIFGQLVAAIDVFINFMVDVGALSKEQGITLLLESKEGLKSISADQAQYQADQDEVACFFDLLRAVLSAGNGHIACRLTQGPPAIRPHTWGWRSDTVDLSGKKIYKRMGDCLGWYCDKSKEVWLEKNVIYAAVQKLARAQGNSFLLSSATLWRRMDERGLILSTEVSSSGKKRTDIKKMVAGSRKRVLVLSADLVESG